MLLILLLFVADFTTFKACLENKRKSTAFSLFAFLC